MFQKKKCINCGASGRFLKLNDHNLCAKCSSLKNKEMSLEEVGNELADWFNSGKMPSKLLDIQAERLASNIRSDLNFERIFQTYNIALTLAEKYFNWPSTHITGKNLLCR